MQTQTDTQASGGDSAPVVRSGGLDSFLSGSASASHEREEAGGDEEEPLSTDDTITEADEEREAQKQAKGDQADDLLKELGATPEWAKENSAILDKIRTLLTPKQEARTDEPDHRKVLADLMAELEGDATPKETERQPHVEEPKPAASSSDRFKFGDIGDEWASLADGYKLRAEADIEGNHAKLDLIDQAMFARRFFSVMPGLTNYVTGLISQAISKHVPSETLQETARFREERLDREGRERAEQLLTEKLGKSFSEMLREDGGEPVTWEGQALDPIPYNRIVAEHPYINEIRREHKDPAKAAVMTWAARMHAAHSIHRMKQAQAKDVSQAAKIMADASAKSATRTERERVRTTAHAGGRSNGKLEGSKPKDSSEVDDDFIAAIKENSPGAATRRLYKL